MVCFTTKISFQNRFLYNPPPEVIFEPLLLVNFTIHWPHYLVCVHQRLFRSRLRCVAQLSQRRWLYPGRSYQQVLLQMQIRLSRGWRQLCSWRYHALSVRTNSMYKPNPFLFQWAAMTIEICAIRMQTVCQQTEPTTACAELATMEMAELAKVRSRITSLLLHCWYALSSIVADTEQRGNMLVIAQGMTLIKRGLR